MSRCQSRGLLVIAAFGLLSFVLTCRSSSAQQAPAGPTRPAARSDAAARDVLFEEQHAAEPRRFVEPRLADLAAAEQFAWLANWVLPNEDHASFRLEAEFAATFPAAVVAGEGPNQEGGELQSPTLRLLEVARETEQLDSLRQRVEAIQAEGELVRQANRLAMLALIDLAREDFAAAGVELEAFFTLALEHAPADTGTAAAVLDGTQMGLLLCLHQAAEFTETSRIVVDPASRILGSYRETYIRTPWQRQFSAAFTRARRAAMPEEREGATLPGEAETSSEWIAASRPNARTRGTGMPVAGWSVGKGFAENLWSHDEDYLYYPVPLRGDYEVECDVTSFDWRDSHLLVAGQWVAPVYTLKQYDIGTVRQYDGRLDFDPPLAKVATYIRYRTVVRDGVATTYFNGRKIHTRNLPENPDPWLAIRSALRHDGGVRNVRITGNPTIPRSLDLSASPDLAGWISYYDRTVGESDSVWRHQEGSDGGEIVGNMPFSAPPDSFQESLLVYHRPMREDGTIAYEFWYEPERVEAHPALDRMCLLIRKQGVQVHWLTDGPHDRTGLSPDNVVDEPANRRNDGPLRLYPYAWNKCELRLQGETVQVYVNKALVYERPLEPTNQRTFGLFHYADQTKLRVRNVVWEGEWPQELPSWKEQSLAVDETGFLDERLDDLKAVFEHDFADKGMPLHQFATIHGDLNGHIEEVAEGVRAGRPGIGGYRNVTIAPRLSVSGDFDITASFEQLRAEALPGGTSTVALIVKAQNETLDEAMLQRKWSRSRGPDLHVLQCARIHYVDLEARRRYFIYDPNETVAGTFRIARRGDQLYFLFADNDSPHYRLLEQETFPTEDLQFSGINLLSQIHGDGGLTSVVWKHLTIRGEKIQGVAFDGTDPRLAALNDERAKLPQTFRHDFEAAPMNESDFFQWGYEPQWNKEDKGMVVVAPATTRWTSAGAALYKSIAGDFDMSFDFEVDQMDSPADDLFSAVYLQMDLTDESNTQISAFLRKIADGSLAVFAQIRTPDEEGGYVFTGHGSQAVRSLTRLRVARRGKRFYVLAKSKEAAEEQLVAEFELNDALIGVNGSRMMIRTGGEDRTTRVICKSFAVRAERIEARAVDPPGVMRAPPPREKSALESIFDLFLK